MVSIRAAHQSSRRPPHLLSNETDTDSDAALHMDYMCAVEVAAAARCCGRAPRRSLGCEDAVVVFGGRCIRERKGDFVLHLPLTREGVLPTSCRADLVGDVDHNCDWRRKGAHWRRCRVDLFLFLGHFFDCGAGGLLQLYGLKFHRLYEAREDFE